MSYAVAICDWYKLSRYTRKPTSFGFLSPFPYVFLPSLSDLYIYTIASYFFLFYLLRVPILGLALIRSCRRFPDLRLRLRQAFYLSYPFYV